MVETKQLMSSSAKKIKNSIDIPETPIIPYLSPLFEIPQLQLPISSIFQAILQRNKNRKNHKKKRMKGSSTVTERRIISFKGLEKGSQGQMLNSAKQTKIRKRITDAHSRIMKSKRPIYTLLKMNKKALKRWNNVRVRKCQ